MGLDISAQYPSLYACKTETIKLPGGIEPDDIIYMRSSEMYLIEAEAKAMLNDIASAQEALRPLGEERDSRV